MADRAVTDLPDTLEPKGKVVAALTAFWGLSLARNSAANGFFMGNLLVVRMGKSGILLKTLSR